MSWSNAYQYDCVCGAEWKDTYDGSTKTLMVQGKKCWRCGALCLKRVVIGIVEVKDVEPKKKARRRCEAEVRDTGTPETSPPVHGEPTQDQSDIQRPNEHLGKDGSKSRKTARRNKTKAEVKK